METSVKTLNFLSMLYLMMIMFVLMLVSKRNKNESYQVFFNDSQWHKIDITRNAEKVNNIILSTMMVTTMMMPTKMVTTTMMPTKKEKVIGSSKFFATISELTLLK